jgi:hypothetical protein
MSFKKKNEENESAADEIKKWALINLIISYLF